MRTVGFEGVWGSQILRRLRCQRGWEHLGLHLLVGGSKERILQTTLQDARQIPSQDHEQQRDSGIVQLMH